MIDRLAAPPIKDAVEFNLQLKPCERFSLEKNVSRLLNLAAVGTSRSTVRL